jgi:hypothetical protein
MTNEQAIGYMILACESDAAQKTYKAFFLKATSPANKPGFFLM